MGKSISTLYDWRFFRFLINKNLPYQLIQSDVWLSSKLLQDISTTELSRDCYYTASALPPEYGHFVQMICYFLFS